MMVAAVGFERTEAEDRRPFTDHGFRRTGVVPATGGLSVIDGLPA
jgi:hypothetical protein